MRILHFIYDHIDNPWVGGGGAVRAFELNRRLARKGHSITMVCGNFPGATDGIREGIEFKFVGSAKNYRASVLSYSPHAFIYLTREYKRYDIIVEDFAPWNPVFSFLYQRRKPIILQVFHKEGREILNRYGMLGIPFYLVENIYPKLFRRSVSISLESARRFGLSAEIIPCGINSVCASKDLGSYVAFLGRISIHNKGLDTLLEAARGLDIQLKIAGRGRDVDTLLERIDRLGLKGRVEYVGFLKEEEKEDFLKGCRFLVLPSRYEGQGIVLLEAAAFGKPVLVSDIPELRYPVDMGFGESFRKGNSSDLKEKLIKMREDEDKLRAMSLRALEYAKNLSWDNIATRYERLLISQVHT
jgi:glycosyltransferase involved in cell wall biosynthesis